MAEPDVTPAAPEPLFAGVRRETARLSGDLRWAAAKRWELARLEMKIAALDVRRLLIGLAIAVLLALAVLPLALVLASDWLGEYTVYGRAWWLGAFLLALVASALGVAWFAWRRFRRDFTGLEATIEELREDLKWLDEHLPSGQRDAR